MTVAGLCRAAVFLQNKVVTLTTKSYKIKKPQQ
jgi:hypothetical protein